MMTNFKYVYGHVLRREKKNVLIEGTTILIAESYRKETTETNLEKTSTKRNK